jgi:hypothetical protein
MILRRNENIKLIAKTHLAIGKVSLHVKYERQCTVKPVLRGHLWDNEKVAYKTGDLLKEVKFIWNFTRQGKKKVTF